MIYLYFSQTNLATVIVAMCPFFAVKFCVVTTWIYNYFKIIYNFFNYSLVKCQVCGRTNHLQGQKDQSAALK